MGRVPAEQGAWGAQGTPHRCIEQAALAEIIVIGDRARSVDHVGDFGGELLRDLGSGVDDLHLFFSRNCGSRKYDVDIVSQGDALRLRPDLSKRERAMRARALVDLRPVRRRLGRVLGFWTG